MPIDCVNYYHREQTRIKVDFGRTIEIWIDLDVHFSVSIPARKLTREADRKEGRRGRESQGNLRRRKNRAAARVLEGGRGHEEFPSMLSRAIRWQLIFAATLLSDSSILWKSLSTSRRVRTSLSYRYRYHRRTLENCEASYDYTTG